MEKEQDDFILKQVMEELGQAKETLSVREREVK